MRPKWTRYLAMGVALLLAVNAHCAIPEPVNPQPGIGVCGTWGEDRWGPLFF